MATKHPLQGANSHHCSWYHWQGDDIDLKHWCLLTIIVLYQADYTIYFDGSTSGGRRNEGAAAVVTRESPIQPEMVTTTKNKGRTFTSSYEEQAAAMDSTCPGHPPMSTILQLPYSFAQMASHYVKIPLQFTILLTPSDLPSSFNGFLAILPFQVMN